MEDVSRMPRSGGLRRALRRAVIQLAPVVLDLGPDQPRFATYLDALEVRGGRAELRLHPIAAGALPPPSRIRRVVLRASDPADAWALTARTPAADTGDAAARVPLDGASLVLLPPRSAPRGVGRSPEPMVALVPAGVEGFDAHVFPVL